VTPRDVQATSDGGYIAVSESQAGYRLGSERGSPNDGSTLASKRVMAQIRSRGAR
jgi:hypothetical protein